MTEPEHPIGPLVSVVIPAHNASEWIGRTLSSVQGQTLKDFEIIVVDDGSTDDTAPLVEGAAASDHRIRLIRQPNGGVARARNRGIAEARSRFVAPIDADDLWHPTRLERHLDAFEEGDPVAAVYSPFIAVNQDDAVMHPLRFIPEIGASFECQLVNNPVACGSGMTVRTEVLREIGGYSPELHDQGVQGYEDWLLQLMIAYRHPLKCVPWPLIGYRITSQNMSSDGVRMRRSGILMLEIAQRFATDLSPWVFWWPKAKERAWLVYECAKQRRWGEARREFLGFLQHPLMLVCIPLIAWDRAVARYRAVKRRYAPKRAPVMFGEFDPYTMPPRAPTFGTKLILYAYDYLGRRRLKSSRGPKSILPKSSADVPRLRE